VCVCVCVTVAFDMRACTHASAGRWPVPCSVTFLGDMETMVDEKEWQANSGRGDSQVIMVYREEIEEVERKATY
jgi:hypothetical protein